VYEEVVPVWLLLPREIAKKNNSSGIKGRDSIPFTESECYELIASTSRKIIEKIATSILQGFISTAP
jgi:hypothetical protein